MPINFIPNDPRAGHPPAAVIEAHAERPGELARYVYLGSVPEDTYPTDSDGFLFWQCREAALRAIDLWELIDGSTLTTWQNGKTLRLKHKTPGQPQLNAFYDRLSLSFFQVDAAGETVTAQGQVPMLSHTRRAMPFWTQSARIYGVLFRRSRVLFTKPSETASQFSSRFRTRRPASCLRIKGC